MSDCSSRAFKVPERAELKPCPFHKKAFIPNIRFGYYNDWIDGGWWAEAECPKCDITMTVEQCRSKHEAVNELRKAWNTRHEPICHHLTGITEDNQYVFITCDRCGYQDDVDFIPRPNGYSYCPGCGAKVVD